MIFSNLQKTETQGHQYCKNRPDSKSELQLNSIHSDVPPPGCFPE